MTATHTTPTGSTITVEGSKLTIITAAGKTINLKLQRTTKRLDNKAGYRVIGDNVSVPDITADWVDAQVAASEQAAQDALEAAVPGIQEMIRLSDAAYNERERYSREFNRMMDDESNDGCRPPKVENKSFAEQLAAMIAANPRAALYLKAKQQDESAHWADNTGKGSAGRKAMDILAAGGSIADAEAAIAVRREFID